jgi:beta-glucosidase
MVLLKNSGSLLPLDRKKIKTVALLGPRAYPAEPTAGGSGSVETYGSVSFLTGMSDVFGTEIKVLYDAALPTVSNIAQQTKFTTEPSGGTRGVKVETFDNGTFSGTPAKSYQLRNAVLDNGIAGPGGGGAGMGELPSMDEMPPMTGIGNHEKQTSSSIRMSGYYTAAAAGDYLVFLMDLHRYRLLVDDKTVIDSSIAPKAVVQQATITLTAGAHKVVIEHVNGPAHLPLPDTIKCGIVDPKTLVSETAKKMAAVADAVVLAVGYDNQTEGEGSDRSYQLLPGQDELIKEIAAINKNTIVVVTSGGSVETKQWIDDVPVLIESWYSGEEGGTALGQLLVGDANFSGRLPISWERNLEDNPAGEDYYYKDSTAQDIYYKEGIFTGYRGFEHKNVKPLFAFGFGLSYTTFKYSHLAVKPAAAGTGPGPYYEVSFDVTNAGKRAGADVAQVYVGDTHAAVERPVKELKGFQRVELQPGETKHVSVVLNGRAFTYYDVSAKNWRADSGEFTISVGRSSEEIELTGKVALTSALNIGAGQ